MARSLLRSRPKVATRVLSSNDHGNGGDSPERFFRHDFVPYQQTAETSVGEHRPVRLSLWNVERIIEAFGGQVLADPNQPGGLSVSIVLPPDRR
jgi:hypothetical protein